MSKSKRLNVTLAAHQHEGLEAAAQQRGTSIVDVIGRCIRVGLIVYQAQRDPTAKLIMQRGNEESEVILL